MHYYPMGAHPTTMDKIVDFVAYYPMRVSPTSMDKTCSITYPSHETCSILPVGPTQSKLSICFSTMLFVFLRNFHHSCPHREQ